MLPAFRTRHGSLTASSFSDLPLVERSTAQPVGWGVVFNSGILTPPVALFERDSLSIKRRDGHGQLFRRPKTRRPVKEHFPRSSRAKRDSALKNQGLAGHRAAASVIVRAATRCPASAAMFSSPTASPLPLFPPRLDKRCGRSTQPFPVRAATLKTPEAGPLSDARAKIRACRATLVV